MARFKPELEFDLVDLLSDYPRAKRVALAQFIKQDNIKREFGNRAIDRIKERTLAGKDKNNTTFAGAKGKPRGRYSDMYKQSLEYAVYGKTDKVNMKLTGQMQASINVTRTTPSGVRIGFISGTQRQKAKGHVMGSGPLPVRDFWGLSKGEQKKILNEVIRDFNAERSAIDLLNAATLIAQAVDFGPV